MKTILIDVENSTTKINAKYDDYTPYKPTNKLVCVQWAIMEDKVLGPINVQFMHHSELHKLNITASNIAEGVNKLKSDLASCSEFMAFNGKYDLQWLIESGFDCMHLSMNDPMLSEYVMARGRSDFSFRLADTCARYKVATKGELFDKYPDLTIDEMPIEEVLEYAKQDIQCLYELYISQQKRLSQDSYLPLHKTIEMMNEFCIVLAHMERAGIKIDAEALKKVETEFTAEKEQLEYDLYALVKKYMGDTKVNLDSPQQLSEVIYSRRIKSGFAEEWLQVFNIGKDERNKNLRRPKMSFQEYGGYVKRMCHTIMKTEANQCTACIGVGYINKTKKDGKPFKKPTKCKYCDNGVVYKEINEIAGFKMRPNNINFTTISGFSTGHTFLSELIEQAKEQNKEDAVIFLEKLTRLSSVSSYLSTFVGGINVLRQADNILHTNFNQCITSTGRLSSTKPNLQNMPREATFPIRKVFISRFEGGHIIDTDFSQLEFRAAVHLAKDERGKKDILNGLDIHKQTQAIINQAGGSVDRQGAKRHCVPTFSRILSKTGFKKPEECEIGELVLTYNTEKDLNEWQPLLAINYYDDAEIIAMYNANMELYSTAEHRWYGEKITESTNKVRIRKKRFFTTKEIGTNHYMYAAAETENMADYMPFLWSNVSVIGNERHFIKIEVNEGVDIDKIIVAATICGFCIRTVKREERQFILKRSRVIKCERLKKQKLGNMRVWCPTTKNGTWIMQQGNTISITGNSFKPLYGGMSGTDAERVYYKSFLNDIYTGIKAWHTSLEEEAIAKKIVTIETGRQYIFPDVERAWHGGSTKKTQIVNFPVQGFATGDIVPVAIIRLNKEMKKLNLKSMLVLTVHDSVLIDTHPDELDIVLELVKNLSKFAEEELKTRYDIDMFVPLANETKYGKNAMELTKVA